MVDQQCFPLPLAPFEAYMLADHRDDFPMQFYFRLNFRGAVDREILKESLTRSIERHPLLRASVRHRFGRTPVWEAAQSVGIRECQNDFDDLSEVLQSSGIDLTAESGLRIWIFTQPTHTQLLFEFHHSCCDGLGALTFLEDVLTTYHHLAEGNQAKPIAACVAGLQARASIPLTTGQALRKVPQDIKDFFRIVFRRPAIATAEVPTAEQHSDLRSAFLSHTFSPAELEGVQALAKTHSTTINNFLMQAVYRSLDQWMCEQGDSRHRWIRMGVPASTRTNGSSTAETCCNQVTIMFLDQHSSHIRDDQFLLKRITSLTRFHKESNIWYSMLQLLQFLARFPPLLYWYLRSNRRMCTTILSNVGRVFESCPLPREEGQLQAGNLLLTSVDFLSPLRPGTHATFAVLSYANSLQVCMHYAPQFISSEHARQLFDVFIAEVQQSG